MKYFETDLFAEIYKGLKKSCKGFKKKQLIEIATHIYLKAKEKKDATKEGKWIVIAVEDHDYTSHKVIECSVCRNRTGVFSGSPLNYCEYCGARMEKMK